MNDKIKPLRLCNHCGYLESDGYEYPEYYCAAGVPDDDDLLVGDGCIYTDRQLKIKKEIIDGLKDRKIKKLRKKKLCEQCVYDKGERFLMLTNDRCFGCNGQRFYPIGEIE